MIHQYKIPLGEDLTASLLLELLILLLQILSKTKVDVFLLKKSADVQMFSMKLGQEDVLKLF